ncbi:MAG: hypothetical protein FWH17_03115 [Oscillospiraceae bacterium]|nr:hypothetical protein [Oscillospiraceae bacterium]
MIVANTVEMRKNFKNLCLQAEQGEKILITRPRQKNLILVSEEEFTRLGYAQKSTPQSKFDILSNFFGIAGGSALDGKNDKDVLAQGLVEKYESLA